MAKVDYDPAPSVAADVNAPNDEQHIAVSPNAFGAQLDQAIGELGEGAVTASNFYAQGAADHATNNVLQGVTNVLWGDPSKTTIGPDGTPVSDSGFLGLRGRYAMDASASTAHAIDQIIQQQRSGLSDPLSVKQFENETRRYRAQWATLIAEHTSKEQSAWLTSTNNTSAQYALGDQSRDPGNDALAASVRERMRYAYAKNSEIAGTSYEGAILQADQEATVARIRDLMPLPGGAQKAMEIFDSSRGLLGSLPNYDQLANQVKEAAADAMIGEFSASGAAGAGALGPASLQAWQAARTAQESHGDYGALNSSTGALGKYQIMPDTGKALAAQAGLDWHPDLMTGDAGRTPQGRQYQDALSRIEDAEAWHAAGGDPIKASVYYYGGQRTLDAYNRDTPAEFAANNPKTAAYVQAISAKLGIQGEGDQAQTGFQHIYDEAIARGFSPFDATNIMKHVEFNVHRDDAESTRVAEDAARDTASYYLNGGAPGTGAMTPDQARQQLPGYAGEKAAEAIENANKVAVAMKTMVGVPIDKANEIAEIYKPTGPENFREKQEVYELIKQNVAQRQQALMTDPAAYLTQTNPDLNGLLTGHLDKGEPGGLVPYILKMQATQTALGVPRENQWVLPRDTAKGIVTNYGVMSPPQVAQSLEALKNEAGDTNWGLVFGDLQKAGLPFAYQALAVVGQFNRADANTIAMALQHDVEAAKAGKSALHDVAHSMVDPVSHKPSDVVIGTAVAADPNMQMLQRSLGGAGSAGVKGYASALQAARQTALFLYTTNSDTMTPQQAASRAVRMFTTDIYDFMQQPGRAPVTIPKGSAPIVTAATNSVISALHADDVKPYPSDTGHQGTVPNQGFFGTAEGAYAGALHGHWVKDTTMDGGNGGLVRYDDAKGGFVTLKNGKRLEIPFSQMRAHATPETWGDWLRHEIGA